MEIARWAYTHGFLLLKVWFVAYAWLCYGLPAVGEKCEYAEYTTNTDLDVLRNFIK
jgi:hypothetical protein